MRKKGKILLFPERLHYRMMSLHNFAEVLTEIFDARDECTARHSLEVGHISYLIARAYGLSEELSELIHIGGHFHDIGKLGIPDYILKKKKKLTQFEWTLMKNHPVIGAKILMPLKELRVVIDMVMFHHERFDGMGYPTGIKGKEIPLGARIISIADTISAMTSRRPYRRAFDFERTLEEIKKCSGSQFDPELVEVTHSIRDEIYRIVREKEA